MKRIVFLFVAALLLVAPRAQAQTGPDFNLRIYVAGAATPMSPPTLIPAAKVVCNQAAPASNASTKNPLRSVWDDPLNAGKVCTYIDDGTGPLAALPTAFNKFEATITQVSGGVETDESNRAPFQRTPPAPKNVRLIQ